MAKKTAPPAFLEAAKATQFKPGEGGRKTGSRNRLSEAFIAALSDDFSQHGEEVIRRTRDEKPDVYMKVVASLLPKEVEIKRPLEDMSDDELFNAIELIRASLTVDPASPRTGSGQAERGKPH